MAELDIQDILKILPHRFPMLLVDRIVECDDEKRIVGLKNLSVNEPFFQGHFPDDPVMPGVMQMEAMAQVGGILLNKMEGKDGRIAYFLAIDNARFRRILRPGDQLLIEVEFKKARLGMARVHGKIICDGEVASEADLMFGVRGD